MYFMYADPAGASDLQAVLEALGDPTRRGIFDQLVHGERTVGALAREAGISQPAASQHLRILSRAGLVMGRREGARRWYRARVEGLEGLRRYASQFGPAQAASPPPSRPV